MSRKIQRKILAWAEQAFGKTPQLKIAIRGNKEMAELVSSLANDRPKKDIGEECADVAFFLMQICEKNDSCLIDEIEKKYEINIRREWTIASDGSHQHVEGT